MNILCQIFLAIYSLIIMAMILTTASTYSLPDFRKARITHSKHLIYLIVHSFDLQMQILLQLVLPTQDENRI